MNAGYPYIHALFKNDVKIYGIKTFKEFLIHLSTFENNVKIYGIKTRVLARCTCHMFENDVKIYGIKTPQSAQPPLLRLRMM